MGVRTVIQGGVDRFLGKGFELQLGAETCKFETEDELKAFLKARAGVSASTLATLREMSQERLERHLRRNERVYKHVLGLLLQVAEHRTPVELLWRELDISELPDEQQWPAILFAVSSNHHLSEAIKRESIERFVEFLRARKALLVKLIDLSGPARIERHQNAAEFEADVPAADEEVPADLTSAAMTHGRDYTRMPSGRDVEIVLADDQRVNLYLSRWKISLCLRAGAVYVEEADNAVPLHRGENSVGRSANCEVPLTNAPLDVSRKHLIINWVDGGRLVLRDLSSKGTWLPGELLGGEKRSEATTGSGA